MLRTALATLPAVILLTVVVLHGTGEALHSQLLEAGGARWENYAALRNDLVPPQCDDGTDDRTDDRSRESEAPPKPATEKDEEEEEDDFLDSLMGDEDDSNSGSAIANAQEACRQRIAAYNDLNAKLTGDLHAFVFIEQSTAAFVQAGIAYQRHLLVLLLLICAIAATALRAHIALRPVTTENENTVAEGGQLLANSILLVSSYFKWRVDQTAGVEVQNAALPVLWMLGVAVMLAINVFNLMRPPAGLKPGHRFKAAALLTVPLYANMALIAAAYFFAVETHPAGLGIYLQKITEHAMLYIHVGLYVWAGMLVKQTRLASLSFDLVRSWKLPAELLAFVVVVTAAIPTAYSGASGIFVIAAGAVIFTELRKAGARDQLALAATAMSGSLGVVLSPCLLVVIVASLNKQVTTDQLYSWGWRVYLLTAGLFLLATILLRDSKWSIAPWAEARAGTLAAAKKLAPYVLVGALILVLYRVLLGTTLGEHTAPVMLPAILVLLLLWDRRRNDARGKPHQAVVRATHETTEHIGALLMLMTLSVCLGGVIERSEIMLAVPQSLGSVWLAMTILVVVLVIVGMIMDPYGAVILVSAAIADIAYRNGIDPVHFWMVVLVAFELGYLSPPVALNHLLTRQVIGPALREQPIVAVAADAPFMRRHERIALPLTVLAVALIIVAYGPLLFLP